MKFKTRLVILLVFALALCIYSYYRVYLENKYTVFQELSLKHSLKIHQQREEKEIFITIFTTFIYDTNLPNSEYRYLAQSNFLRMTTFDCFRENASFIIFTNSKILRELIVREYPHVLALPYPTRGEFNTPMLKDLFLNAQEFHSSFFYMFANADTLYDSSLLQSLVQVKEAWKAGLIRQKLLIVGQRYNIVIQGAVESETAFQYYFENSKQFFSHAQEYFIVTKDSFEWLLYPEVLVGRSAYDNMLIDMGVRNELVTIDATSTIRAIHQSEKGTEYSSANVKNKIENDWNQKLAKFNTNHWSTNCARYKTEYNKMTNEVNIYDKKINSILDLSGRISGSFVKEHRYWIEFIQSGVPSFSALTPSLVVAVLAFNKPDSLTRLLMSLADVGNNVVRIDLFISLDIGKSGYYDLPTLMVARKFEWLHGKKQVLLKDRHRGQLYQWLEVHSSLDNIQATRVLILEDCMVLSPHWYEYLSAVLEHSSALALQEAVAGWSLEFPVPWRSRSDVVRLFYRQYAVKSSLVLASIKRVRSLIPNMRIWKGFVEWFLKEFKNVRNEFLYNTLAARLENRGVYTDWPREMWVTWFSYYLELNHPKHQIIGYIIRRSGFLCQKMHVALSKRRGKEGGNCYTEEVLASEMGIQDFKFSLRNDSIFIPKVVPKFKISQWT